MPAIVNHTSSGVFSLDSPLSPTDLEQLHPAFKAMGVNPEDLHNFESRESTPDTVHRDATPEESTNDPCMSMNETAHMEPFIHVKRGENFAAQEDPAYWAKTFPCLFPWGVGGARQFTLDANGDDIDAGHGRVPGLKKWAKLRLLRHGGYFAKHPVFPFLVYNILTRSGNRRISMQRVTKASFESFQDVLPRLTPIRLQKAAEEMKTHGNTTDKDIRQLLDQLASFGFLSAFSNEARLLMRRRIKAAIIRHSLPAIWFTINPNDLTNPIRIHLSVARTTLPEQAEEVLVRLRNTRERLKLTVEDPVSAAIFFYHEISVFCNEFLRIGEPSSIGQVSFYFGAVETNERSMLHMHGMIWLQGNLAFPNIASILSSADPDIQDERQSLQDSILRWCDSNFKETLNDTGLAYMEAMHPDRRTLYPGVLSRDPEIAWDDFIKDSNRCAKASQRHAHTATCYKYKKKQKDNTTRCRFGAPWALVKNSHITEEGVIKLRRDHDRVVRYNPVLAVAFRHNHDFTFMHTKTRGLSAIYYMTNYSTKLDSPLYKRLGYAARVQQMNSTRPVNQDQYESPVTVSVRDAAQQFLMKVANRFTTERELSSVEVVADILEHDFFITPLSDRASPWPSLNMNMLYKAVCRAWPAGREKVLARNPDMTFDDFVTLTNKGQHLLHIQAYPYRGPVFKDLCLYDYVLLVQLKRPMNTNWSCPWFVPFPEGSPIPVGWIQQIRTEAFAIPVPTGYVDSDFAAEDDRNPFQAAIHHLGLFVPWHSFTEETELSPAELWERMYTVLEERLKMYATNIQHLRRSAEDARVDAKAWAEKCAGADCLPNVEEEDTPDDPKLVASAAEQAVLLGQILSEQVSKDNKLRSLSELVRTLPSISDLLRNGWNADLSNDPSNAGLLENDVRGLLRAQADISKIIHSEVCGEDVQDDDMREGSEELYNPGMNFETRGVGSMDIGYIPRKKWVEVGKEIVADLSLNTKQALVLFYVARHLDKLQCSTDAEQTTSQKLIYVGGGGGVGKSHLIHALAMMFRIKDENWALQITAQTGAAAANINGRTLHSAIGVNIQGRSKDDQALKSRWKKTKMLIHDEVSMTSGDFFKTVSEQIGRLCDMDKPSDLPFGGVPIVMVLGDFAQFEPVRGTSLIFPGKQNTRTGNTQETARRELSAYAIDEENSHHLGYELFKKFRDVIILDEQMRARGDPDLLELLSTMRAGMPSEKFYERLMKQVVSDKDDLGWEHGTRAITPRNKSRWRMNMDATLCFAKSHAQVCRIFISAHTWTATDPEEKHKIYAYGDSGQTYIPGIFFYTDGMPVITNKNQYPGLKLMNGTEFTAYGVVISNDARGLDVGDNVFLHFGPPAAILLQSEATKDLCIEGLPRGTIALGPDTIELSSASLPFLKTSGTTCKRRGIACTPAFAITDHKAQGRTFDKILVELTGRKDNVDRFESISAYVSLSRCKTLAGIKLLDKVTKEHWRNAAIPAPLREKLANLQQLDRDTQQRWKVEGNSLV